MTVNPYYHAHNVFAHFDPYKDKLEKQIYERGVEHKKLKARALVARDERMPHATSRKPVTLAKLKWTEKP